MHKEIQVLGHFSPRIVGCIGYAKKIILNFQKNIYYFVLFFLIFLLGSFSLLLS
jgi:hypothetical protein